jgi:hypothetical protein
MGGVCGTSKDLKKPPSPGTPVRLETPQDAPSPDAPSALVPLMNEDPPVEQARGQAPGKFLVPALLPVRHTNQNARLVGYIIFGPTEIIEDYRKKGRGYVSVDEVKQKGVLPKDLIAAVLASIVQECELVHDLSFSDMEVTTSSISTAFGRHQFELRHLPDCNMMQLILMVDSPLLVVGRLRELIEVAVEKLMPSLRFATYIDQEGGTCLEGQVTTPTGYLVLLDGNGGLQQRLGGEFDDEPPGDIKVAPRLSLSALEARKRFGQWLIPRGVREWYHVFLSYRWGDFDSDLVKALFFDLSSAVFVDGRQVHVCQDRYRLEVGSQFASVQAKALINSLVAVPVVSVNALERLSSYNPHSSIDNVLCEWMLIVELRARGHLNFCFPIIIGKVDFYAKDGKFISNRFLYECIENLPQVVCTKEADHVNKLLVENGMKPSESVRAYTVRDIVKMVWSNLGWHASDALQADTRLQASEDETHFCISRRKALYKRAAAKVLECVEKAGCEPPNQKMLPTQGTAAGRCRVFLGYRVASDADLVGELYYRLKSEGVDVWWDNLCLPDGQPWEQSFADGLCSSDVFVPVLSKAALAPFAQLTAASACDNVLLEQQLALELYSRKDLRAIYPVLVGELKHLSDQDGDLYSDFFKTGGVPACPDEVVKAVEDKVAEHLERLGKGALSTARTVKATLDGIKAFQGVKMMGTRPEAIGKVVSKIVENYGRTSKEA